MAVEPKLLVVWGQYPRYMYPVTFTARQTTIAAKVKGEWQDQSSHNFNYFEDFVPQGWIDPNTSFDLAEYCDRNGLGRDFDFIVAFLDEDMGIFPTNLGAFHCPAILLVGDSHHFPRPISTLISYARHEKIDMIGVNFTAHHLHWFKEAGLGACAWIPGLHTREVAGNSHAERDDRVVFVGHSWEYHHHRFSLLETMRLTDLPLEVKIGTREEAAESYSRSLISFNCSLNSDVNIRNFEVLCAGGFLLTDDLPEVTGFRQLFRPGEGCDVYRDADDLLDKIAFYRRNPSLANNIAGQGRQLFQNGLRPNQVLAKFKRAFFEGKIDETMRPPDPRYYNPPDPEWQRRLETYEDIQEIHRKQRPVKVLIRGAADWLRMDDFVDLPRVRFYSTTPRPGRSAEVVSPVAAAVGDWDYVAGD